MPTEQIHYRTEFLLYALDRHIDDLRGARKRGINSANIEDQIKRYLVELRVTNEHLRSEVGRYEHLIKLIGVTP